MSGKRSTPGLLRAMNDCLYGSSSQLITCEKSKATPVSKPMDPAEGEKVAYEYKPKKGPVVQIKMTDVEVQNKILSTLRGPPPIPYTLFMKWDTDKSGKITPDEFEQAVADLGIPGCKPSISYALFDIFDKDKSGILDYQELYRKLATGKTIMQIRGQAKL